MTAPSLKFNNPDAPPQLKDVLDLFRQDLLLNLNCHAIATVTSFNAAQQTVQATVNYQKTYFERASDGSYSPVLVSYPVLMDCPIISLAGAAGRLTFPIAAGDQCLVLFNDRDLSNWFAGATSGPVASGRLHSFSDGVALVGIRSMQTALTDYNTTDVELGNGAAILSILGSGSGKGTAGTFLLTNANALSLGVLLQALINAIKSLTVSPSTLAITPSAIIAPGGGGPCSGSGSVTTGTGTVSASSQSTLTTIANELAGLLS